MEYRWASGRRSSVVEHYLGKVKATSSILVDGSMYEEPRGFAGFFR